jgi:aminoglycoside phosphotransferase (APT) family kinase protein
MNHVEQFGALLGAIHRHSAASPEPLRRVFDDRSFFESLRIEPYYEYTAAQIPEARDFLHELIADTRACRLAIVHGDFSPKNMLVHDGRLVLIDHEVIHWGDPAFDVGFALTHLVAKAIHLREIRFIDAALLFHSVYDSVVGPGCDAGTQARTVRHTLGCLLARIAGRSPLEYLGAARREELRTVLVRMLSSDAFLKGCSLVDFISLFTWGTGS